MNDASDMHIKRMNRAAGARPARELTGPPSLPNRKVPSALQPATFAHRVGMGRDTADPALQDAARAFNGMARVLDDLHKRERTIRADRSKTPEAHSLSVAKVVEKNMQLPAQSIETARASLMAEIDGIDSTIEASFRSRMDREDAQELRSILRSMTRDQRRKYLASAMKEQNFAPIAAILAHPEPVASGMSATEREGYRKQYEQSIHGDDVKRRDQLIAAAGQLQEGWERYMNETIRLRDPQADELDAAAKAAEDALNQPLQDPASDGDE